MTSTIRIATEQRKKVEDERREVLLEGATLDQWKSGKWPTGSTWLWAIGVVGPKGSAVKPDQRTGE